MTKPDDALIDISLEPIDPDADLSAAIYQSPDCQNLIKAYHEFHDKIPFELPWVGYFILGDNTVIGSCGYTGPPVNGSIEIAYWTFSAFEGKGVASFACGQLIHIAYQENPNLIITAKTAPERNASVRILEKHGFVYRGVTQDDEIGEAWLWSLE